MRAYYGSWLIIENPGVFERRLARLATYRRKGRVPPGEDREVCFYRRGPGALYLPRGLLAEVRGIIPDLDVIDRTRAFRPSSFGWRGRLRPEQAWVVDAAVKRTQGLIVAPPGIGKTELALGLAARLGQPALWLTHTKDLARDAFTRARRLYNLPPGAIGYHAERQHGIGTHLTVATVQSLADAPEDVAKLAARIGCVLSDEAHHDSALTRASLVSKLPARYRYGMTATDERTDGLEDLFLDLYGGVAAEIPLEWGFRARRLMRPSVRLVRTGWATYDSMRWDVLQRARAAHGGRNVLICRIARREWREGRHVMILTELVDHARYLAMVLGKNFGVPARAIVGDVPPPARLRAYRQLMEGRVVLVATRLADEGLNLPALDTVILAAAGRSKPRLRQQVGRIMRILDGKADARVYDLVDADVPALADQAKERRATYEEMGLPVRSAV